MGMQQTARSSRGPAAMIVDRMTPVVLARRLGYRTALALLRVWWFVRRPRVHGVKCVLTDGDRVLLVRHAYGRRDWELPGGAPKRGERYRDTARREIGEELGLTIEEWADLGTLDATSYSRQDTLHIFHARVHAPRLALDLGELAGAEWFDRDGLPPDLGTYVAAILERVPR
jgi:8-oxo-dGTP pyrophosphatase MutT (NUDIX family)